MNLNSISTYTLNSSLRYPTTKIRNALDIVQKELVTGKKNDLGNSLGSFSSSVVLVKKQIDSISQIKLTNGAFENRLSSMQNSMTSMVDSANAFIGQLTAELNGTLDKQLLQTIGQTAVGGFTSAANVSLNGEYLFSGINSESPAMVDYQSPSGSAAKIAVQNAFQTAFGFSVNDPAAQGISPNALKAFFDGPFMDLFNDANWETLWTGGSQLGINYKISTREIIQTPTTLNEDAFRDYVAASVLIDEFSDGQLKPSAINQIATSALELMATSVAGLGDEQSKLGTVENRVSEATKRMSYQQDVLAQELSNLTDVDSYEAAIRLNQLTVSLESSYAITARIQSLSILNFL